MTPSEILDQASADKAAGRLTEAASKLGSLVAERPNEPALMERIALLYHALGDLPAAASAFEAVCRLQPESARARGNFATVLGQMGRYEDATRQYEFAIGIDATAVDAQFNLAQMLEMRRESQAAITRYRIVVAQAPSHNLAWYRLGYLLFASGFRSDAQAAYRKAIEIDAEYVEARWALTMSLLPLAYDVNEAPATFYAEFSESLDQLDKWFSNGRDGRGNLAVGNQQPYFLSYHNCNNRAVLSRYGDLCARLMNVWFGEQSESARTERAGPLRIVIISGNIHDHAVWTAIVRGWCRFIDRARFQIAILYTDNVIDAETEVARACVETFVFGKRGLGEWVDTIKQLRPEIIIYPEVGMDRTCIKLSALRLAPVQAVAWGNPETSGMPTVDYFISAAAFEPPNAAENYRERLVPLAGIGAHYSALNPQRRDVSLDSLGLDPNIPILLCPATPYKFLPEYDWTYPAIAAGARDCQLVFVSDNLAPHLSTQLARRFEVAFEKADLDYRRYVRFISRLPRPEYFSLMRQSALYLDTIVFSGFNTAMQALECGLPVVTVEGQFLRNRFASGLLRTMGMDDLVAVSPEEHVRLAVRLLNDAIFMREIRAKLANRFPLLLDQTESVRSLERFLESVVSPSPRSSLAHG